MTASVKILTTSTVDSSPSILIVSPNGHKTLINCGEGCQRSFLESTDRVRSVNQIVLTHIGYESTGGLPGMILTSADAAQASVTAIEGGPSKGIVGTLQIIGPNGVKGYVHSLRHFMRRDRFPLTVHEGEYHWEAKPGDGLNSRPGKGKKRKQADGDTERSTDMGLFGITSIPMKRKIHTFYGKDETSVSSYLFTTTPIAGKFQIQKAKSLQIPPGPLYSKLKAGESVRFCHPSSGNEVTVTPDQVLEGGSDGVAVALIYCPDEYVFDQFCANDDGVHVKNSIEKLNSYKEKDQNDEQSEIKLELMVHYTPKDIFESTRYQTWMREFGTAVKHMTIHPVEQTKFVGGNEEIDGSPFRSAVLGAMQRSLIQNEIYPSPIPPASDTNSISDGNNIVGQELNVIRARPGLEYVLVPLAKQGLASNNNTNDDGEEKVFGISKADYEKIHLETERSGALEEASKALNAADEKDSVAPTEVDGIPTLSKGSFIFTGTGSAIPCKHRNVTGMYLEMKDGNGMLLDVGEGTLGQLIRSWKSSYKGENECEFIRKCITNIKAVWISHPHADHQLGIIRFLTQRNAILMQSRSSSIGNDDRVVLMTSVQVLHFLDEYSKVDPSIYDSYIPVDNRDTLPDFPENKELNSMLNRKLGITRLLSVPVSHCYQSFAVVIDGTSFGKLVYSGDCRPSEKLVKVGHGADLLVHEATFEDGMEEEAVLKMHSTVSEALSIAKRMDTKACILTHFSQRYPRIPPLREEDSQLPFPVAFAFDFMKVNPENIGIASKLTSSLRMLYPDDDGEEKEHMEESKRKAQEILSTPGLFANLQCKK